MSSLKFISFIIILLIVSLVKAQAKIEDDNLPTNDDYMIDHLGRKCYGVLCYPKEQKMHLYMIAFFMPVLIFFILLMCWLIYLLHECWIRLRTKRSGQLKNMRNNGETMRYTPVKLTNKDKDEIETEANNEGENGTVCVQMEQLPAQSANSPAEKEAIIVNLTLVESAIPADSKIISES